MKQRTQMARRSFLRGAGGFVLATPFLSSLAPKQARAATGATKRFFSFWVNHGPTAGNFFPAMNGGEALGPNVRRQALGSIAGPMSPYFGSGFDRYRDKMLFLEHLDVLSTHGHNFDIALAGGTRRHRSIDHIIGDHAYEAEPAASRVLNLGVMNYDNENRSHSYGYGAGNNIVHIPGRMDAAAVFDDLFAGGSPSTPGTPDTQSEEESYVVDRVLGDYQRLRSRSRLSSFESGPPGQPHGDGVRPAASHRATDRG